MNSARVLLPSKPKKCHFWLLGKTANNVKSTWDQLSHTLCRGFDRSPGCIKMNIEW